VQFCSFHAAVSGEWESPCSILSEISISNIQRRNRRIYEGTGDSIVQTKRRVEVLELNVQPDHVHLVVSIPPKYAVSEFMGYLKGKLALRLFQQYESLGRRYWGRHLWARGYCVSTIGLDEEKIRK